MEGPGRLVERAVEATGLDDFGDSDWREGLDRFVDALDDARLNDLGRMTIPDEIVGYLTNRLRIVDHAKQHPEIVEVAIERPIFVVGQARTGTTILHDLLAQDPASRVPLAWEVDRPCPPPESATYLTDPRIEEVESVQSMVDLVIPGFRAMHPVGARLAQECVRITGGAFRSMIFPTQYRVPAYARWLLHEADMAPAYRWHKTYLRHLGSRHAADRWVLKSPGHIWCLDALLEAYPDALLVQTHRDPLRIIASVSSLMALLRQLSCEEPTMREAAEEFADYILLGLDRSVDARESGSIDPSRVVDVPFGAFISDQIGAIRGIYEHFGMELGAEVGSRMQTFLDEHPQDKHGLHAYTFEDTGLDAGALRERAARYQSYFDVRSEF